MALSKHEMFKEAYFMGVGEEHDEKRRAYLRACATKLGTTFTALRNEYDAWEEGFSDKGAVPSLEECARKRDFMPARIALVMGESSFQLYSEHEIDEAQIGAGITLDPEDPRRAKAIAEQSARWELLGSTQLGGYEIVTDAYGSVTAARYVQGGTASPVLICKYFFVRGKAQNYEGDGWHYVLEFRDDAGMWKVKLVPANTVGGRSDDWVRPLRDAGAVIVDAALVSNLMQITRDLKIIRIAAAPGWQNHDYTVYTTLDGTTLGGVEETEAVFTKRKGYGRKGSKEEADRQIFNLAVRNSRLICTITGMLAGPFLGPLHVHPGLVHLHGASGDGKSVSQRCGQAVMGSGARILSWNTTENGLEGLATQHHGSSMAIEELKQGAAPKAVYKGIMALGNGSGKQAMTRDRKPKDPAEFQVFAISSGEADVRSFLTAGKTPGVTYDGGVASRCADIPSDAKCNMGCFEDLHGFSTSYLFAKALEKASTEHYGHHLPALLAAYLADPEAGLARLKALMSEALNKIGVDGDENVTRVIERFALMAAVGEFAAEKGVLSWPAGEALHGVLRLVADWRSGRHGDAEIVAGSTEALVGVQHLEQSLAKDAYRFQRETGLPIANRLGFLLENDDHQMVLYLSKSQLAEIVGAERVQPVLQYLSDDKSSRFALRKGAKAGFQVSTPRKAEARMALGNYAYGIILRDVEADELGAAALRA